MLLQWNVMFIKQNFKFQKYCAHAFNTVEPLYGWNDSISLDDGLPNHQWWKKILQKASHLFHMYKDNNIIFSSTFYYQTFKPLETGGKLKTSTIWTVKGLLQCYDVENTCVQ